MGWSLLLAQTLQLIIQPKAQLAKILNVDLMFSSTPVLRVGNSNLQFAQSGAIGLHNKLHRRLKSVAGDQHST